MANFLQLFTLYINIFLNEEKVEFWVENFSYNTNDTFIKTFLMEMFQENQIKGNEKSKEKKD